MYKSSYCTIKHCEFNWNEIIGGGGAGTITLSNDDENPYPESNDNKIMSNKINAIGNDVTDEAYYNEDCEKAFPNSIFYQGIYLARGANNSISYNTINNPSGAGILTHHDYTQKNDIMFNVIDVCYNEATFEYDGKEYDITSGKNGIIISGNFTYDNRINNNYCYGSPYFFYNDTRCFSPNYGYYSANGSRDILLDNISENECRDNYFNHDPEIAPIDPFWKFYNVKLIKDRLVSGDFDGDGRKDDIAAMYDYGNGKSQIHVWIANKKLVYQKGQYVYEGKKTFEYKGVWWSSNGYSADKVSGRFVSGDFNGDGTDDLAAMYDYEDHKSRLHTWISDGHSFSPGGYANTWWSSEGYDANKVTNRFVSGDFNDDGKDDIAAMYDYGNQNSSIHTWISDGTSFSPNGYANTWWSSNGYDASKVTNRFVSGDFNDDGKDDIAAMYDYGNQNSSIHTWISDETSFSPNGYANTWWSSNGYDASKVTGRFVCSDIDGDGKHDITAMYDYGNSESKLHTWISEETSFSPNGYADVWWESGNNSYDSNPLEGLFISGDFDNNGLDDILGFYDYTINDDFYRVRTHVWESLQTKKFKQVNNSLGYAWMDDIENVGLNCYSGKSLFVIEDSSLKENKDLLTDEFNFEIYPNPIKKEAFLKFVLLNDADVLVELYALDGKRVEALIEEYMLKGEYTEKLKLNNRLNFKAGIYILRIKVGNKTYNRKVSVLN